MQHDDYAWSGGHDSFSRGAHSLPFSILLVVKILEDIAVLSLLVLAAGLLAGAARSGGEFGDFAGRTHGTLLFLAFVLAVELGFLTGVWMKKKWGALGHVLFSAVGATAALSSAGPWIAPALFLDALLTIMILAKWPTFE
jgi:hypothetical protein